MTPDNTRTDQTKKQAEDGSLPNILPLNHHAESSNQQNNDGLAQLTFLFFHLKGTTHKSNPLQRCAVDLFFLTTY